MEINFASSDSLRLEGRWVREGESVTKWGNRSNISHLLIGCKAIYMWWGDIAWFFELLHLQWFVKLSHGWKGPNVKKIQSIRPKVTLNNPWHPYLTRFELNFSKLPLIIRPPPWCAASWQSRGLTDWHLASSGRRLFGGSNPQETGSCPLLSGIAIKWRRIFRKDQDFDDQRDASLFCLVMFQFNACVKFWDLGVSHMFLCPFQRSVSEAAATPLNVSLLPHLAEHEDILVSLCVYLEQTYSHTHRVVRRPLKFSSNANWA